MGQVNVSPVGSRAAIVAFRAKLWLMRLSGEADGFVVQNSRGAYNRQAAYSYVGDNE